MEKQKRRRAARAKLKPTQSRAYAALITRAQTAGLSLAQVCDRANINLHTVDNWQRKSAKTLDLWFALNDVIDAELSRKHAQPEPTATLQPESENLAK